MAETGLFPQNYGPLLAVDDIVAPDIYVYQNGTLILATTHMDTGTIENHARKWLPTVKQEKAVLTMTLTYRPPSVPVTPFPEVYSRKPPLSTKPNTP